MERHELGDEQWALIEDLFPKNGKKAGRPWSEHRRILNGMFWILGTGAPWRDLPKGYGPWQTVHRRFSRYRRDGTFDRILERLQVNLDENGKIDWDLFCIDGSSVRAHRAAAGAKRGGPDRPPRMSPKTTLWAVPAGAGARSST